MEIITVQLGSYANFVGSHFWNIQDEALGCAEDPDWSTLAPTISSEVVCAWSEDRYGDTSYTPRTVAIDLSGALGGVSFKRAAGSSEAAGEHTGLWAGGVQVQQAPSVAKSRYRQQLEDAGRLDIDLDDPDQIEAAQQALEAAAAELHDAGTTPRYWTDFLQVDLADSCVLTLSGAWQGQLGWDGWGVPGSSGGSALRELVEAAVDRVRWWAEQCDRMQGLQLLADDLGGWGGISHDVLQQLREEYPTQPVLYFSLQQQQQQQQQEAPAAAAAAAAASSLLHLRHTLSKCISLSEVPHLASLYVPLDAGSSHPASGSHAGSFQTAALLAAAVDTLTLPLRCTGSRSAVGAALGPTDLHSLVHLLSGPAANLAAAALQLPAGSLPGSAVQQQHGAANGSAVPSQPSEALLSLDGAGCRSLSPGVQLTPDSCLAESVTLRGARTASGALSSTAAAQQALDALLLQRQRQALGRPCVVHSCISPLPVAAPLSFPRALLPAPAAAARLAAGAAAGGAGSAGPCPFLPRSAKAPSVPAPGAFSRLVASSEFESVLQGAARDLQRLGGSAGGRAALQEWGYGASDLEELRERLLEAAGKYSADLD